MIILLLCAAGGLCVGVVLSLLPRERQVTHATISHTHTQELLKNKNNFWQRISWLSQRWRTQRNAIRNVNCRIPWIIESLNAPCALWYSKEHVCLRIIAISCFCRVLWRVDPLWARTKEITCQGQGLEGSWSTTDRVPWISMTILFDPSMCKNLRV